MRKDIMTDIETLGKTEGSTIIQIAAMSFDIKTGEIFDQINLLLDITKVNKLNVDGDTLKWWLDTNKELLARLLNEGTLTEEEMAQQLHSWLVGHIDGGNDVYMWGNGILFDNKKLQQFLNGKEGLAYPIYYRNDRDVRTILELASIKSGIPERELIESVNVEGELLHDALDDTRKQIRLVHKCYNILLKNN